MNGREEKRKGGEEKGRGERKEEWSKGEDDKRKKEVLRDSKEESLGSV